MVVIKWFLLSLFIILNTYAQFDWFAPDRQSKVKYYLWNAVTGTNLVTDTDVFLYGSFTKEKVPKDSLDDFGDGDVRAGTTSASKYMAYYLPGELNHQTINRTFESGTGLDWILSNPAAIITSEFAHSGTKSLKFGVLNGVTNFSVLHRDSTIAESNQWYLFDFWIKSDAGATATFTMYTAVGVPRNFTPIDTNWAHIQISSYASTYTYIYIHKSSGTNGDYYIDDFSITHLPDSVRTLARSISLDDLVEDTTYTYYCSVLQPNGRYSKGDDSTFTTPLKAPENLIADGTINKINLTWVQSGTGYETFVYVADSINGSFTLLDSVTINSYSHVGLGAGVTKAYKVRTRSKYGTITAYSNIANATSDEETIPLSLMSYSPDSTNFGTVDTLNFTVTYDSTISDIDTTGWTYTDSTAVVDTIEGGTPDLAGWLVGTSVDDFSYKSQNAPHTFTASGGYYNVIMDSSDTFTETNYAQKTFTAQSDSVFIGCVVTIPSSMTTRSASDAQVLLSAMDSVAAKYCVFGIDDGDANSVPDRWIMKYSTGAGTQTIYSTTNFTGGVKHIEMSWDRVTNYAKVFVNDTLLLTTSGADLTGYSINAVRIGNATSIGSSEYVKKATFSYDSVYADSRGFMTGGTTYDTTWTYTDSTAILDTTWIASNDTTFYTTEQIVYAENVGEVANEIISIAGLSAPYSIKPDFTTGVVSIGSKQAITIVLDKGYDLGTFTDTLIITDNEGAHNLIVTGVLTTPELLAPTNLTVTHNTDTTAFKLDWDKSLSTHDSTRIYISSDGITFTWIASLGDETETYNAGTYTYGDKRYFRIAALRSGTISDYTASVNYTLPNQPAPPASDTWTYDLYVTPTGAGSHSGLDLANAMTLQEAVEGVNKAQAGDTVFVQKGCYTLPDVTGGELSFSASGTASNPIVFRGVRADEDETIADSVNNTFINAVWNVSSGALSITGAYITLDNMIIRQRYTDRVTTVINVSSSGHHFTMDSVVVQYPENNSSGSYHTLITYADYTTLRYCYFYRGCRTIIWVRASYPNTCDGFLMENTTIDGYSNHYAIQCMPSTSTGVPIPKLTNGIIRNCVFKNSGYESALYIRNVSNYKIYNNVFVNGGGRYAAINLYSTDGATSEDAYDTQSIFANNTIYSTLPTGSSLYSPGTMIFYGLSNQNGWTIKNNLASFFDCTSLYRNGCALSNTPSGQDYDIDYNMIYNSNRSASGITSPFQQLNSCTTTSYTWTNWKARGFDTHSIIDTDPNFVNPTTNQSTWDFHLGSQRAGTDLSSWGITTDYDGVTRTNWTIGAFEYVP